MDKLLYESLLIENDFLKEEADMKDLYIECININYSNILYEAPSLDVKSLFAKLIQKVKEFIAFVKYKFKQWIRKIGIYLKKFYVFLIKNDIVLKYTIDNKAKFKEFRKKFVSVYTSSDLTKICNLANEIQSEINKSLEDDKDGKKIVETLTKVSVNELTGVFNTFDNTQMVDSKNKFIDDEHSNDVEVSLKSYKEIKSSKDIKDMYKKVFETVTNIDKNINPLEKRIYELEKEVIDLKNNPEVNAEQINALTSKIQSYQKAVNFCMKAISFLFKFARTGIMVIDEDKKTTEKIEEFYYNTLNAIRKLRGKDPIKPDDNKD